MNPALISVYPRVLFWSSQSNPDHVGRKAINLINNPVIVISLKNTLI